MNPPNVCGLTGFPLRSKSCAMLCLEETQTDSLHMAHCLEKTQTHCLEETQTDSLHMAHCLEKTQTHCLEKTQTHCLEETQTHCLEETQTDLLHISGDLSSSKGPISVTALG